MTIEIDLLAFPATTSMLAPAAAAGAGHAGTGAAGRLHGRIGAYTDDSVTLKDKEGREVVVAMTPGWTVSKPRSLPSTAVKPGDFVATANKVVDEHTGQAVELRIMEPGYRPEYGTHLMAQSGNAMTHGTVGSARQTAAGVELEVGYPGGWRAASSCRVT
jgi:hypothetical protein